jgi:hypothetical protein
MARGEKWEYRSMRVDVGGWLGSKVDLTELGSSRSSSGSAEGLFPRLAPTGRFGRRPDSVVA